MAKLPDPISALHGDDRRTYQRMLARRERHGVGLYGPYVPLLNHPQLAERIEALGGYLKFDGVLPRDRYQFVVLAFSHAVGAEFEWRDHVRHALDAGVPQPVIDTLVAGGELAEPYRTLAAAVEATIAYRDLPHDVQDRIVADVGIKGLVEVVALCGLYALIAMVSAAFDVPVSEAGQH